MELSKQMSPILGLFGKESRKHRSKNLKGTIAGVTKLGITLMQLSSMNYIILIDQS